MYNYTKEIAKWFTWTPNILALWCIEVPLCVFQMYHLHCSCDKTSCGKRNICLIKSHQDIHHCTVSIWKKLHLIWPTDVTAKVSGRAQTQNECWGGSVGECNVGGAAIFISRINSVSSTVERSWTCGQLSHRWQEESNHGEVMVLRFHSVKNLKIKAIITLTQLQPSSTLFSWMVSKFTVEVKRDICPLVFICRFC